MQIDSDRQALMIVGSGCGILVLCLILILGGMVAYQSNETLGAWSMEGAVQATATTVGEQAVDVVDAQSTAEAKSAAVAAQSTIAARSNWRTALLERFDSPANPSGWPLGVYTGTVATGSRQIVDGRYRWQVHSLKSMTWWSVPNKGSVSDMYLRVDAQQASGDKDGIYGLVFHYWDNDNFYMLTVRERTLRLDLVYKGQHDTIFGSSEIPAIHPGGPNTLLVTSQGPNYTVSINDHFVAQFEDKRLPVGLSGVMVGFCNGGENGVFEFKDMIVRAP